MQKNTERLQFQDFNVCCKILHADANMDAGGIVVVFCAQVQAR